MNSIVLTLTEFIHGILSTVSFFPLKIAISLSYGVILITQISQLVPFYIILHLFARFIKFLKAEKLLGMHVNEFNAHHKKHGKEI
jgi:hypothetical protein